MSVFSNMLNHLSNIYHLSLWTPNVFLKNDEKCSFDTAEITLIHNASLLKLQRVTVSNSMFYVLWFWSQSKGVQRKQQDTDTQLMKQSIHDCACVVRVI